MTLNYSKSDRKEICSVLLVNSLLQAYFNQCNKQNTLEIKINLKTFSCKMQQKNILCLLVHLRHLSYSQVCVNYVGSLTLVRMQNFPKN